MIKEIFDRRAEVEKLKEEIKLLNEDIQRGSALVN
jgi:hypothetical protein